MADVEDPFQSWVASLYSVIEARLPLVVVEGSTDKRCLMRCFHDHHRDINDQVKFDFFQGVPIEGQLNKHLVFEAMKALNALSPGSNHAIGIVDADFMRAMTKSGKLTESRYIKNVFFTDAHDLDCQIFQSMALDKFIPKYLVEYGDNAKELRERCLKPAAELGYFKLSLQINKLHHLREKFRDIVEFINPQFEIDEDLIHNAVNGCTTQGLITQEQTDQFFVTVAGLKSREIDPWQLANGHDLFRVLGLLIIVGEIHLRHRGLIRYRQDDLLLNTDARKYFAHRLEHHIRKFYDLACFKASSLYRTICNHQDRTQVFFVESTADIYESIEYITRGMVFEDLPTQDTDEVIILYKKKKKRKKKPLAQDTKEKITPAKKKQGPVAEAKPAKEKKKKKKKKLAKAKAHSFKNALQGVILTEDAVISQFYKDLTHLNVLSNEKEVPHFCATMEKTCFTQFQRARNQISTLTPEMERDLVLLLFSLVALLTWISWKKFAASKKAYKAWVEKHLLQYFDEAEKPRFFSVIYHDIHCNIIKENRPAEHIKFVQAEDSFLIRQQGDRYEVNLWALYDRLGQVFEEFCEDLRTKGKPQFSRKMQRLMVIYG